MSSNQEKVMKSDDTKMKNGRAHLLRPKFETTKLRDMLREKCRIRVKESRERTFMISRKFFEDEKDWLAELLKEELKELHENIELQEMVYKELVDEFSQWLLDEYERETDYMTDTATSDVIALCPTCQVSELALINGVLRCSCGFKFNYNKTLKDFWNNMQIAVAEHEERCNNRLSFFTEPKNDAEMILNVLCKNCDFYATL